MGIILLEPYKCRSGCVVSANCYVCIGWNMVYSEKIQETGKFLYHCSVNVYWNKSARDDKFPPLEAYHAQIESDTNENGYEILYKQIKSQYNLYAEA